MQAEGIRKGDRCDVYDDHGKIVGGWVATEDAKADGDQVSFQVLRHDGPTDTARFQIGEQVPLSWGAGPKVSDFALNLIGEQQRREERGVTIPRPPEDELIQPRFPEGTPEYAAYAAELRAELRKFANHEPPYDQDELSRERQIGRLKP